MHIVVIVPTYDEAENLPKMVSALFALPLDLEVLIVDDASPDGTGRIAEDLAAAHPGRMTVVHRAGKLGLASAYLQAFRSLFKSNVDAIAHMDCDFSHDPEEIPNFLKAAQNNDLVIGSRYSGGVRVLNWPLKRLLLSRCAGIYVWLITGMPFTDPPGGYKCFRRRALQSVKLETVRSNGYSFQIEMTHRLWRDGFKVTEVPITFADRVEGTSKLSRGIVTEAIWMVWWLWLQNGLRRWPRKK